jgi:UDP-glucose 4-epimerase
MERVDAGLPPQILGGGSQTMDFVYIDDVAQCNLLALQSDVREGVFNVGSGTETRLDALASALLGAMQSSLEPEYGPARLVDAVLRRCAATAKADRMLGFRARVDLDEGLARLVQWWRRRRIELGQEPLPAKVLKRERTGTDCTDQHSG